MKNVARTNSKSRRVHERHERGAHVSVSRVHGVTLATGTLAVDVEKKVKDLYYCY